MEIVRVPASRATPPDRQSTYGKGARASSWARGRSSMDAMTMTDAHFWVNGATEDEPVRCRAGSRRLGALRVGRIGALRVVGVAPAP